MNGRHGGNVTEMAVAFNVDAGSVTDFSASINPLGMSMKAKEAVMKALDSAGNYPDIESYGLEKALSQYHRIPEAGISAGNGATEFIYLIPMALKPKRALIVSPAFSEYERSLCQAGCRVEFFEPKEDEDFKPNLPLLAARLKEGFDILWIGNPGNPTGSLIPRKEMLTILNAAKGSGTLGVVDEAFMDFNENESVKHEVNVRDDLIVIRSMTKFFALAGLRVGYAFARGRLMDVLKGWKKPWTLNRLGEAAAIASLRDADYREKTLCLINEERRFLYDGLSSFPFLKPYPSGANFILLRLGNGIGAGKMQERLLKEDGLLVRDCGNFRGLQGEFIRVAIRSRAENALLLEALKRASMRR